MVRKALEQGFEIAVERQTRPFFDLYARTVRDHGTPVLPRRYFQALLDVFGEDCEILTVRQGGKPISSVLSFFHRDKVLPYYTGSALEARRSGANDMMYWALMRRSVERVALLGVRFRPQQGRHRPLQLQEQLGVRAAPHHPSIFADRARYAAQSQSRAIRADARLIAAWQRLPLPVANAISPFISRDLALSRHAFSTRAMSWSRVSK